MFAILGADRMLPMSYADVLLPIAFKFDPQQSKWIWTCVPLEIVVIVLSWCHNMKPYVLGFV